MNRRVVVFAALSILVCIAVGGVFLANIVAPGSNLKEQRTVQIENKTNLTVHVSYMQSPDNTWHTTFSNTTILVVGEAMSLDFRAGDRLLVIDGSVKLELEGFTDEQVLGKVELIHILSEEQELHIQQDSAGGRIYFHQATPGAS